MWVYDGFYVQKVYTRRKCHEICRGSRLASNQQMRFEITDSEINCVQISLILSSAPMCMLCILTCVCLFTPRISTETLWHLWNYVSWFIIRHKKSHCGDMTVAISSYFDNGISILIWWYLYIESWSRHSHISPKGARSPNELQRRDYMTGYHYDSLTNGC